MPVSLNLLPPELSVGKNLGSALKTIRAIGVIALGLFIVFVIGVSALFIFQTVTLNNTTNNVKSLEAQVLSQETSEQQVILLKNRISKIVLVQQQPSAEKNLSIVEPLLSNLPPDSTIGQLTIDSQKVSLSVGFRSNIDLSNFLDSVEGSDALKGATLSSFGFSPISGYLVGLDIVGK